jgi:hypothetical protein
MSVCHVTSINLRGEQVDELPCTHGRVLIGSLGLLAIGL